jgi:hypothetical protein
MPGGWTDQSERDLLFTIIKLCAPTGMNWEEVSAMMGELGYGYTKEAVRYVPLSLSLLSYAFKNNYHWFIQRIYQDGNQGMLM